MKRLLCCVFLFLIIFPSYSCGEESYETALPGGLKDSDHYAYLLILQSRENRPEAIGLLKKAAMYAPDLPAVYFELAKASFSFSKSGILNCTDYALQGIDAYLRNFWWSFSLAASAFFSLVLSFALTFLFVVILRLFSDLPLISHDIGERNLKPLMLLFLVGLSLLSPFYFVAAVLMLLGIYMKKIDRILVYMYLVFLVFSPLILKEASFFINALSSGSLKAVVKVNTSKDNRYALSVLSNGDDDAERFSYGLAKKRQSLYKEAVAVYKEIVGKRPSPKAFINLGNCYVGLYNFEEDRRYYLDDAMKNYRAAVSLKPLASAYYNMSQVSREMIDFPKGNEYFKSALSLDRSAVAEFSSKSARTPNSFVVDETLTSDELRSYARRRIRNVSTFGMTLIPLFFVSLLSFLLIPIFYVMNVKSGQKAYRCRKCSVILCTKCEKRLTWGQLCPQCYGSLVKLDELDAKERVSRLLSIYERQRRRRNVLRILSFLLPGASLIYAGRVLFGFFFLWPFLFFIMIPFANMVFITDSTVFTHHIMTAVSLFGATIIYVMSNFITRGRLSRGWL